MSADWPFVPANTPISELADVLRDEVSTAEDGRMAWKDSCALAIVIESKLAARGYRLVPTALNIRLDTHIKVNADVSHYLSGRIGHVLGEPQ